MNIYLLKTKYNQSESETLLEACNNVSLTFESVNEYFESDISSQITDGAITKVPAVIAVHDGVLIHQESSPFKIGSFQADADAKLDEHLNG